MNSWLPEYKALGFDPIPLRYGGRTPRFKGWRTADYSKYNFEWALRCGYNYGWRLTVDQLVIDVDPRNGGDWSFAKLCEDLKHDLGAAGIQVATWRGGKHYFWRKPPGLLVRNELKDLYPGVEFKTFGRYVVAVGSVVKGLPYRQLAFTGLVDAPPELLRLIERPARPHVISEGGELTVEQLARLLAVLDPEDFRDYGEWFQIACAAHDATGGEGLDVWLNWCRRDGAYDTEAAMAANEAIWAGLKAGGGVTYATIVKLVKNAGGDDIVKEILKETLDVDMQDLVDKGLMVQDDGDRGFLSEDE